MAICDVVQSQIFPVKPVFGVITKMATSSNRKYTGKHV